MAWWCRATDAGNLLEAMKAGEEIVAAARRLDMPVTEHAVVLARATRAAKKIEAGMAWAQRTGVLHQVNSEYRRRRLQAEVRGERFMLYAEVQLRLRKAIVEVAAGGNLRTLVESVFEVKQ
jgi:hypothetical protein